MCGLQAAAAGSTLGVPITELALLNTYTLLLWQLKAIQQEDIREGQSTSADPAVGLGERVLSFCLQLEGIFEASGDPPRLQDCIFRIQADVFLVFSSDTLEVGPSPLFGTLGVDTLLLVTYRSTLLLSTAESGVSGGLSHEWQPSSMHSWVCTV